MTLTEDDSRDSGDNLDTNGGNGGRVKVGGSRSNPTLLPPRRACKKASARKFVVTLSLSLLVGNNDV